MGNRDQALSERVRVAVEDGRTKVNRDHARGIDAEAVGEHAGDLHDDRHGLRNDGLCRNRAEAPRGDRYRELRVGRHRVTKVVVRLRGDPVDLMVLQAPDDAVRFEVDGCGALLRDRTVGNGDAVAIDRRAACT